MTNTKNTILKLKQEVDILENLIAHLRKKIDELGAALDAAPKKLRLETRYVNVYESGVGLTMYRSEHAARRDGIGFGWRKFGQYIETKPIVIEVPA